MVLGKIWSLASIEITNLQHRNNLSNSISVLKFLWCSLMRCSWRWYIIWRFLNLDFQVEFTIISLKKTPSVFSWLSTYTVHAVQSGNALQLTNHILKWCFRVSTGCPVVFFILEEENTGPYLDRRFTSLVCIFDCCFYHAITAIEYAEDIPLINYQNLTCCARCKIKNYI